MPINYYIDECGNTGDAKITRNNFNNQPFFTLAAVSIPDENDLSQKIEELKKKHRINLPELKSSKIYGKKNEFFYDLFKYLDENDSKFIIEIVDKRSYLISVVVTCFIFPMYLSNLDQEKLDYCKGIAAQIIYPIFSDQALIKAHDFTISPSNAQLESVFSVLEKELSENLGVYGVEQILDSLRQSIEEYEKDSEVSYKYYLQESDLNKRGEPIAFLSHLPSFCNIYARINMLYNKKIKDIKIIHDNQDHFNHLIKEYKQRMEEPKESDILKHHTASDYYLTEAATLEFSDSKQSIGIQVSDCIAGFAMRFFKDLSENNQISDKQWKSFCILQQQNNIHPSLGTLINCPEEIRKKVFMYCNLSRLQEFHKAGGGGRF